MAGARLALPVLLALAADGTHGVSRDHHEGPTKALPAVAMGTVPLDTVLMRRRSVRAFSTKPLSIEEVGQLCWAAQGITDPALGLRTAPSAGALYPLELYAVLPDGVFHYTPREHALRALDATDHRAKLASAAYGQSTVLAASATFVVTAVVARTRAKYGERAERYVYIEAGHAAQNLLLEAAALGLAAVPIGAFDDAAVRDAIGAPRDEVAVYAVAVGHPPDASR